MCLGNTLANRGALAYDQDVARTVADLMLSEPKTLPAGASVDDARRMLASGRTRMLLLVDGPAFRGAVTSIPEDAAEDDAALTFVDAAAETLSPDTPTPDALGRLRASPHGRIVVLGDGDRLLGLLCLNRDGTGLCTPSGSVPFAATG